MKTPVFVILYLFVMMFTYLWRFAFVSGVMQAGTTAEDISSMSLVMHCMLLLNYLILIWIAYARGKKLDKKYLAALPLIGGFFDILLVIIPFVPTLMNLAVLVLGLSESQPKVIYVQQAPAGELNIREADVSSPVSDI